MGNQWFFSEDMLKEARLQHPEITELTTYRRHIWSKSPITFKTQDGATVILYLDSNILSNYTFSDQP